MTLPKTFFTGGHSMNSNPINISPMNPRPSSVPPFSSKHASSRKRSRSEFEAPQAIYAMGTPAKRTKLTPFNNIPPQSATNPPPTSHSFDDDRKNNIEKNRGFQSHGNDIYKNGKKKRKETRLNERRKQREAHIQRKYQHHKTMNSQLSDPNTWDFNFSSNQAKHSDGNQEKDSREISVESTDSDEIMTDFNHTKNDENSDQSNIKPMNGYTQFNNRATFQPTSSADPQRKYRSKMNQNEHINKAAAEHKEQLNSNPFPTNSTPHNNYNVDENSSSNIHEKQRNNSCYINTNINAQNVAQSGDEFDGINVDKKKEEKESDRKEEKEESVDLQRKNEEKARKKKEKKRKQEEEIKKRTQEKIEELKKNKIEEANTERLKHDLRERIHPQIIQKAHPFKNNPVELIKLFYAKTRITREAKTKEISRAFKRALAHFHPDRTINKSLREQIEAEEIFKLLSQEKEEYEKRKEQKPNPYNPYNRYSNNRHRKQKSHGWF